MCGWLWLVTLVARRKKNILHVVTFVGQAIELSWPLQKFFPYTLRTFQCSKPGHVTLVLSEGFPIQTVYVVVHSILRSPTSSILSHFNPLKTQFVPRSKHFSSRL